MVGREGGKQKKRGEKKVIKREEDADALVPVNRKTERRETET